MKKLSIREWILVVSLLLLSEYMIFSNSYTFRDDQSLLNYISFASTIASLLLAVIAIIYGFVQNISNTKSNSKMLDRIDEFQKITKNLIKTTNKSDTQLERLTSITDILSTLKSSIEESTTKLNSVEEKISEVHKSNNNLTQEISKLIDTKPEIKTNNAFTEDRNIIARTILRNSTIFSDLIAYALNKVSERNEELSITDFIYKYITIFSEEKETSAFNSNSLFWNAFNILYTLNAFGLIKISSSDKPIFIEDDFKDNLRKFSLEIKALEFEPIKQALAKIDSV